ncbi:DNA-directed RNA polymerase III subunit RPC7 isoform X3 [Oncorhynchus tshawytscha]|nr:DNA-directed RNA polymerase III subunit RPC7 isoform X3 [Oncorhynchus tshawytscha]XP_024295341.1 DNA-directed RNA polymerase III subunit RPC7 isoform X3 [Oncorhynchus tshawytscha]XP_024295342.1 DNA-directed RNA polymerase III subunit RPC7 isoform X3 [Oncorhynchus tshawytscha]XP_042186635.1 DNA-directed RNA polymerase III subunit RPC7 isoform X3 [Oncorhynchus tshawytscha]
MAGGKGRGIAAFSFNIESLGLSRGNMPQTREGPNKLYPGDLQEQLGSSALLKGTSAVIFPIQDVEFKPVPLKEGEDEDYMLALKQEIRGTMRLLPHNIKPLAGKGDVERYKERYQRQNMLDEEWTPDWQLFPKELMPQKKKLNVKPVGAKKKPIKVSSKEKADVLSKLDELEKKDVKSDEEKEEKKTTEEGEEEEIEGEELEEEELEEENDYIASYFEDGDDFGAGSDENMDEGATY